MGIVKSIRKYRRKAKAEIKAAQKRASSEVKARAKRDERQAKLLAKQEKELIKSEQKGLKAKRKHEKEMAENQLEQIKNGTFNKDNVKRGISAARLLTPLLLPLAYRGLTALKDRATEAKAKRYGVSLDELAQFSGYGTPLKARIQGIRRSISNTSLSQGFVRDVSERLDKLDVAIDNAEYMTPDQRKRTHAAIKRDINDLTGAIEQKLGPDLTRED